MEKLNNDLLKEKDVFEKNIFEEKIFEINVFEKEIFEEEKLGVLEGLEDKVKDFIKDVDKEILEKIDVGVKWIKSFFRWLLIGLLVLVILVGVGYMLYVNYIYSEGMRVGNFIKIFKKGMLFKIYEG